MAMQGFTAGSPEGMSELVSANARTVEHYAITLNPSDFEGLVYSLRDVSYSDSEYADWAGSFLSGIAETLGIEFI